MAKAEQFVTLADIAEETGIRRTTLYKYIERGHLKANKVGFFTVVSKSEAEAFKKRLHRINLGNRTVTVFQ